jgi:hypothetical protein
MIVLSLGFFGVWNVAVSHTFDRARVLVQDLDLMLPFLPPRVVQGHLSVMLLLEMQ